MEAVAALAVALAFVNWLQAPAFPEEVFGTRYTNLALLRPRILLAAVTAVVTLLSLFVLASILFRAVSGEKRILASWTKGLGLLNLLIVVWFLSVEKSLYRETCLACFNVREIRESRAFCWLLSRQAGSWNWPTLRELVAADLGIPCRHAAPARFRTAYSSGACLVWDGCFMRLYDRPVYPPCARAAIRSWLAADPILPATFHKRVFVENDRAYSRAFFNRLYDECPDSELPDYLQKPNRASWVPR